MPRYGAKDTVDGTRNLDVLYFQRNGLFAYWPGWQYQLTWRRGDEIVASIGWTPVGPNGSPIAIRLNYSVIHGEERRACDYEVAFDKTPCNYGGARWWFICPGWKNGQACCRRCRFLYLPFGGSYFACRRCYDLSYESQQRSGNYFHETVFKPLDVIEKLEPKLARARSWRRKQQLLRRILPARQRLNLWIQHRG